jgi:aspartyl-tRNA(Asn)/glutamyl-tRNA(Gln) amidotransferase subunit A
MPNLTIRQAQQKLRSGEITALELTKSYLNKIKERDGKIGAYLTVTEKEALAKAKETDASGDYSRPLAGIPISLKDVVSTKDIRTTAASKILENYIPAFNATVWQRLKDAGAILLGKVNTDEFTMGSSCENSALQTTRNPHDLERVPGGSSGGAAASVASDQCIFSIGTDTGGSIRQPANFCGTVGLKVTYGRVPRYGCIPYASSFDTVGPITKTVEDAALVLEVIAGPDGLDTTSKNEPMENYSEELQNQLKGKKVGIITDFLVEGIDPKIKADFQNSVTNFAAKTGVEIVDLSLPLTRYAIAAYYLLAKSEASTNLARYDGIRYGARTNEAADLANFYSQTRGENFGPEVKRAIMMGTFALSSGYYDAYYRKAAQVRKLIKDDFERLFKEVDVLLAPVSPVLPFKIGEKAEDPLAMYLVDAFTVPINLAGLPSLAVPTGKIDNLPTGLQIIGPQFAEKSILNFGWHLEQLFGQI